MIRILVVEDEKPISNLLRMSLEKAGYSCTCVFDGAEAAAYLEYDRYDLILLDIMLPGEDGISLLKQLKASVKTQDIPVIMMTAKGTEYDKVMGLDLGADDYVTKPFGMMELISRIKAVLRRSKKNSVKIEDKIALGHIVMDVKKHEVQADGQVVTLTLKEFELLKRMMKNPDIVLTRDQLLEDIWGYDFDGETRTVDVHVRTLRQKLGSAGEQIQTVRGVGYRMSE